MQYLREVSGNHRIDDEDLLARDLGMDSLARADLVVWLQEEFGFAQADVDSIRTVGDVLLGACGQGASALTTALKPVAPAWFATSGEAPEIDIPAGETVMEVFLRQARRGAKRPVIADQRSGVRTFRDVLTATLALREPVAKLTGDRLGIMLPASVAADVAYLTTLFAGKTPVMVNWTVGPRNVGHCLDAAAVTHVLTSSALLGRLESQGVDLSAVADRFVPLEELARGISWWSKLRAAWRARFGAKSLRADAAGSVAAILFTSGSESLPKAVPLSHANLLANLRDVLRVVALGPDDRLVGMLPPFHAFGLTVGLLAPLLGGLPTVYHADPTAAALLAKTIEAYRVSMIVGTPTFLHGIVRAAAGDELASLRLAVTGAEKCPERVYQALESACPWMTILEGYGVTECSPILTINDPEAPVRGAIGKPLPSVEHLLVHPETGQPVARGEQGMLLVRGPNVFAGYLGHDGESPFVEVEGKSWYRTGDLVSQRGDGVLVFRGRWRRFVKLGGEMISLPAIEGVLDPHFATDQAEGPAIAIEAGGTEEQPELVLFTTQPTDRQTVNALIRAAGLSALHNIRRVIQIDELPLLGTGKTDYRELKRRLET